MTLAARRSAVHYLKGEYGISERRACRLVGLQRSTLRYQAKVKNDGAIRTRLRELATERPRFGYRRLHVLLRREGYRVNHKRVHRLYRQEGLTVRRRPPKRVAAGRGGGPQVGEQPNDCWCLDFVSDTLASGRRFRALSVLDTCTREALTIAVDTSLLGARVVCVLDNRPELISRVLDQWAYDHHVQLQFIDPGKSLSRTRSVRASMAPSGTSV